jgi:hypothetical protein
VVESFTTFDKQTAGNDRRDVDATLRRGIRDTRMIMDSSAHSRKRISRERLMTVLVVTIITLASLVLMLSCTSPELSWDEADYAANTAAPWSLLWGTSDYGRHYHGPMAIYLAKL